MGQDQHGGLRDEGVLFRTLVENALVGVYLFQDGRMLYVNPTFEKITGRPAQEIVKSDVFEFIHPEDRDLVRRKTRERLQGKIAPEPYTFRIQHPQEGTRWIVVLADRVEYAGKPALLGNLMDITERVQAEQRYRILVENAHEAIVVAQDGVLKFVNPAAVTLLGYDEAELLSRPFLEFIHPEDRDMVGENYEKRLDEVDIPPVYSFRLINKAGQTLWVEIRAVRIVWDSRPATLNFLVDISDRKRSEDQLRASEARYRSIASAAKDAIIEMDAEGRVAFWNESARQIFGYTAEEAIGRSVHALLSPAGYLKPSRQAFPGFQQTGKGMLVGRTLELVAKRKDGQEIPVELSLAAVQGTDGWRGIGIVRDISERKAAEEALRRERDRAQAYLDLVGVIVVSLNESGEITLLNRKGHEILGYAPAELLGKNWFDTCIPARIRQELKMVHRQIMGGKAADPQIYENPVVTSSGEERIVLWHNSVLTDESGNVIGTLSAGEDITQRLILEAQFRQAQKMEAIGRLAGGVAHDFNNALTTILGYSELILASLQPEDPHYQAAMEIRKAGKRAASLTQQLLAFSRRQIVQPRVLDFNVVVNNLEDMLRRLLGEDVQLETVLAPDLGRVKMDPSQAEQVLMNVAVNARDAMPKGGRLTIETANAQLDEIYARTHGVDLQPGPFVMLAISDTGMGMDEETRHKVFEPFFTTKQMGQGTGLGLSMVYGTVKQNGGFIWVYSEPGQGTTFKIYLPRVDEHTGVETTNAAKENSVLWGSETILLVEDDEALRTLAGNVLSRYGYRVLSARDGQEALGVSKNHRDQIQLLVTDVIMPGMSGRELADSLLQSRPDLKVLYMTGYTDDTLVRHGLVEEGVAVLEKPFAPDELARKVRDILGPPQRLGRPPSACMQATR